MESSLVPLCERFFSVPSGLPFFSSPWSTVLQMTSAASIRHGLRCGVTSSLCLSSSALYFSTIFSQPSFVNTCGGICSIVRPSCLYRMAASRWCSTAWLAMWQQFHECPDFLFLPSSSTLSLGGLSVLGPVLARDTCRLSGNPRLVLMYAACIFDAASTSIFLCYMHFSSRHRLEIHLSRMNSRAAASFKRRLVYPRIVYYPCKILPSRRGAKVL